MSETTQSVLLFEGEPLTVERARNLARRGYGAIDIEIWLPSCETNVFRTNQTCEHTTAQHDQNGLCTECDCTEFNPSGFVKLHRRRSPTEVYRDLRAVLGKSPEGGEEYFHVSAELTYTCATCPDDRSGDCSKTQHMPNGPCFFHQKVCARFVSMADAPWPNEGRLAVFSVRGGSEGDYVHVKQGEKCILLAKTFQGRDAAWQFSRNIADLLGV